MEVLSLGRLSAKTEELQLPMKHGYSRLDANPVFICHGEIIIIYIIIIIIIITTIIIIIIIIFIIIIIIIIFIIIIIIIIELTHSKTILKIKVEIEPQPTVLDFKNLSQYSSCSK